MVLGSLLGRCSVAGVKPMRRVLGTTRGMKILSAHPVNNGKQLDVEFTDKTAYRFHVEWMKDASPSLVGSDYYRKSAAHVFDVNKYVATEAQPADDGSKLVVHFQNDTKHGTSDEYVATWLHAFAPHVGQPLHDESRATKDTGGLKGTGSLLEQRHKSRQPWGAELQMPTFDANVLAVDEAMQIDFLEKLTDPGVAIITGVEPPQGLENELVGQPLERLVGNVIGRLNQHPVRSTRYGVMHTRGAAAKSGADYDHANPLSMHTDHSVYNGTPGYIQFMYQAQGSVKSKVCDGLALANAFREQYPEEFHLLTTVQLTHSSRNGIYAKNGAYCSDSSAADAAHFELVHTHPVIELDADGCLEKVVQSETKRGVCALPFDTYEKFMAAYRLWTDLVEQPRFVCDFDWPEHSIIAMNNWRVMHGRASVPPGMDRTMCFGYVMKTIFENRYRFLRQRQVEKKDPLMNDKWLTRLPNQVLYKLVR